MIVTPSGFGFAKQRGTPTWVQLARAVWVKLGVDHGILSMSCRYASDPAQLPINQLRLCNFMVVENGQMLPFVTAAYMAQQQLLSSDFETFKQYRRI